nr:immunoglobulin heavy chain junction region [Mus musculus]MBK4184710.1 immunoglobulin heavy chain junction region [Mus musculus]
CARGGWAFW